MHHLAGKPSNNKPDNPKTEVVRFRCTPEQKKNILDIADREGLTLSRLLLKSVLPK